MEIRFKTSGQQFSKDSGFTTREGWITWVKDGCEVDFIDESEVLTPADEMHHIDKHRFPNFAAGGIATPADAALMMQLGAEAVFVGSGIFKSEDPYKRAKAIVDAVTYYDCPEILAEVSRGLGEAMAGIDIRKLREEERLAQRGW